MAVPGPQPQSLFWAQAVHNFHMTAAVFSALLFVASLLHIVASNHSPVAVQRAAHCRRQLHRRPPPVRCPGPMLQSVYNATAPALFRCRDRVTAEYYVPFAKGAHGLYTGACFPTTHASHIVLLIHMPKLTKREREVIVFSPSRPLFKLRSTI